MKAKSLTIYFAILFILCAAVILGAKLLGQQGAYLTQRSCGIWAEETLY